MKLSRTGISGSLESNDALVTAGPAASEDRTITVESVVEKQFGGDIRRLVAETLDALGVTGCTISVQDRGALDFTLRARVETAIRRAGRER